jgi:hypothetical protein
MNQIVIFHQKEVLPIRRPIWTTSERKPTSIVAYVTNIRHGVMENAPTLSMNAAQEPAATWITPRGSSVHLDADSTTSGETSEERKSKSPTTVAPLATNATRHCATSDVVERTSARSWRFSYVDVTCENSECRRLASQIPAEVAAKPHRQGTTQSSSVLPKKLGNSFRVPSALSRHDSARWVNPSVTSGCKMASSRTWSAGDGRKPVWNSEPSGTSEVLVVGTS